MLVHDGEFLRRHMIVDHCHRHIRVPQYVTASSLCHISGYSVAPPDKASVPRGPARRPWRTGYIPLPSPTSRRTAYRPLRVRQTVRQPGCTCSGKSSTMNELKPEWGSSTSKRAFLPVGADVPSMSIQRTDRHGAAQAAVWSVPFQS